jgi:hypothetical protein
MRAQHGHDQIRHFKHSLQLLLGLPARAVRVRHGEEGRATGGQGQPYHRRGRNINNTVDVELDTSLYA